MKTAGPLVTSCWVAAALVVAGFVGMGLAWRGAADTLDVDRQIAYLVSGGLGGLLLIVAAASIVVVQVGRHLAAREAALLDEAGAAAGATR